MTSDTKNFGLKKEIVEKLKSIFSRHSKIEKVVIYGSRAKGNYRDASDIDICMFGSKLTTSDLLKIEDELDELLLPYKIDLSLFHQIDNDELIDHIKLLGRELDLHR